MRRHNKGNQKDITIVNMYASNIETPTYLKQILTNLKEEIYSNIIIAGNFNIILSTWLDHPERKSIQ